MLRDTSAFLTVCLCLPMEKKSSGLSILNVFNTPHLPHHGPHISSLLTCPNTTLHQPSPALPYDLNPLG
jgi:hypothetical protein